MQYYNLVKQLVKSKLGQELPGWAYVVGLIIGLFTLVLLIWVAVKSGRAGVEQIVAIK